MPHKDETNRHMPLLSCSKLAWCESPIQHPRLSICSRPGIFVNKKMSSIDSLIQEKCSAFREYMKLVCSDKMKKSVDELVISDDKIQYFKLYLLLGGTPEKFSDLVCNRYQIDEPEKKIKIYRFISCIFELLTERISLEKNETDS